MRLTPTIGSNSILFGAKYDEVIRVFGTPDSDEVLQDFESHPNGRRSLKYGDFSLTLGSAIGVFGMGTSIRTDPIYLWDTKINDLTSRQFAVHLASHGATFETSPQTAWGSTDMFSADHGILAYFASDRIYNIQISVPYSCPSQY